MGIPTCAQKDGQTGMKTLLSRNFIKGMEIDLAIIKETAKQTTKKGHLSSLCLFNFKRYRYLMSCQATDANCG